MPQTTISIENGISINWSKIGALGNNLVLDAHNERVISNEKATRAPSNWISLLKRISSDQFTNQS